MTNLKVLPFHGYNEPQFIAIPWLWRTSIYCHFMVIMNLNLLPFHGYNEPQSIAIPVTIKLSGYFLWKAGNHLAFQFDRRWQNPLKLSQISSFHQFSRPWNWLNIFPKISKTIGILETWKGTPLTPRAWHLGECEGHNVVKRCIQNLHTQTTTSENSAILHSFCLWSVLSNTASRTSGN